MNHCANYGSYASILFFCIPIFIIGRAINFHKTRRSLFLSVFASMLINILGLLVFCYDASLTYIIYMTIINVFVALGAVFFTAVINKKIKWEDGMK